MKLTMLAGSLLPLLLLAVTELSPALVSQQANTSQGKPPTLPKLPIVKKNEAEKQGGAETKDNQGKQGTKRDQQSTPGAERLINPITGRPYLPDTSHQNDLIQRFAPRNPLLGIWRISAVARPGQHAAPPVGYFTFTHSHLSIQILSQTAAGGSQIGFQSSLRVYRIQGDRIFTTSLVGARTGKKANELLVERRGLRESHRFSFVDPHVLRLYTGLTSYFELVRIADI